VGEGGKHELGTVTILDVGGRHDHGEYEAGGVDDYVTLASTDFFARIELLRPTPSRSTALRGWWQLQEVHSRRSTRR
jgi:hypothetical protein